MDKIMGKHYNQSDIASMHKNIECLLYIKSKDIKTPNLEKLSSGDLQILFYLYDEIYFDNFFKDTFKGKIVFSLSSRLTKSAGKTITTKNIKTTATNDMSFEIRMGVGFFLQFEMIDRTAVCGIIPENSLHAFMLVLEHEICHILEFIYFKNSSCKKKRFKNIANNLFGHTESYHALPTNRQIASVTYNIKIGDHVNFFYKGLQKNGRIYNITKRATVMVVDKKGVYKDTLGCRYSKFYVPVCEVRKV